MALADTFKALSDEHRRQILTLLREGRCSAGELSEKIGIPPAALSYHLKLLKKSELVMEYKEKNFVFYELNTSIFEEIILWMKQFGGNIHETDSTMALGTSADRDSSSSLPGTAGFHSDAL